MNAKLFRKTRNTGKCVYKNVAPKTATVSLKDLVGRQIQIQSENSVEMCKSVLVLVLLLRITD